MRGKHSFSVYSLWEYLVVPKRTEVCFLVEVKVHSFEVDGCGCGDSGEVARDPTGVLPCSSSFFSAFSILFRCVSSLLMASPRRRSISLDVDISNRAATSLTVSGLYFLPKCLRRFFSNPCQFMYPIASTLTEQFFTS